MPRPVPEPAEAGGDLVAQAAQHLELELLRSPAPALQIGDRLRKRAQIMGGDCRANPVARVDQPPAQALEAGVALALLGPHRRLPSVLGRDDPLVVPVGALDQPDGRRHAASDQRGGGQDPVERLLGVAKVGLDDDADRWRVAKLPVGEHLLEGQQEGLPTVVVLHVEVNVSSEIARQAKQRPHAVRRVRRPPLGRERAEQGSEGGELDREVRARQPAMRIGVEQGLARPVPGRLGEQAERAGAALEVGLGLALGDGRLAQEVEGEGLASAPHAPQVARRVRHAAPSDELASQQRRRRPACEAEGREHRLRGPAGPQRPQCRRNPIALDLAEKGAQVGASFTGPPARRGHVDEAEERRAQIRALVQPAEQPAVERHERVRPGAGLDSPQLAGELAGACFQRCVHPRSEATPAGVADRTSVSLPRS